MLFTFRDTSFETSISEVTLRVSQDLLDLSYPNTNYEFIARSTFYFLIANSRRNNELDDFLKGNKQRNGYFLLGHDCKGDNERWNYYYSSNNVLDLEGLLLKDFTKNPFDFGVVLCCNSKKIRSIDVPFPVAFPYGPLQPLKYNEFIIQKNIDI